jgi:anti-sigma regulatory factor (Ser/Thr protein kinase)
MQPSVRSAPAARMLEATYPGTTEQIRYVRADLRAVLEDCPAADDVVLCASELAGNAVLHSRSRLPGGIFTVRVAVIEGACIRIAVVDNGGPWGNCAEVAEAGRHGLDIVRVLARKWGVEGDDSARIVWAALDWPRTEEAH